MTKQRVPMNLCGREFRTRLEAREWSDRQVVRRERTVEYQVNVRDVGNLPERVRVLDRSAAGFEPETSDEPLSKVCQIWKQNGLYRVGIPTAGW